MFLIFFFTLNKLINNTNEMFTQKTSVPFVHHRTPCFFKSSQRIDNLNIENNRNPATVVAPNVYDIKRF